MVKFGENSATFGQMWANLRNFGEKQQKIERFLTEILRLERPVQRSALCRSRRELSNGYFLAKFGFDTAENELI